MDKFFPVIKPSTGRVASTEKEKQRASSKYNPYSSARPTKTKPADEKFNQSTVKISNPFINDGVKPSSSKLTKHLLSTLSDKANPITHSDIGLRSDYVSSEMFKGHQTSEGRGPRKEDFEERAKKLAEQMSESAQESQSQTLHGTSVYINGYLDNATDTEMKRILTMAGARVLNAASGATHILTSQQLSGSKTHKLLTTNTRIKTHVVRPEWVTDSISASKRLPERNYSVIRNTSTGTLAEAFSRAAGQRK